MEIAISFFVFFILPFVIGNGILLRCEMESSVLFGYVYGWVVILASFQIFTLPVTFCNGSLTMLTYICSACFFGLFLFALVCGKNGMKDRMKSMKRRTPVIHLYGILAVVLLVVQLVVAVLGMHGDADDAYYIGASVTSLSTDTLYQVTPDTGYLYDSFPWRYVFSALMIFWAYLGKITSVHPLIIAHTIIAPIFILVSYFVWWEVGKYLFKKQEDRWLFFLFLNILNIWGNTSAYTQSSFLLFRIWQGKAMLPNIILPVILYLLLGIYKNPKEWKRWIFVFVTVLAGCCCSSMAVPLCIVEVMAGSLVLLMFCKNWKMLVGGLFSCIPCVAIGIVYLLV